MSPHAEPVGSNYRLAVIGPLELRDPAGELVKISQRQAKVVAYLAFGEDHYCQSEDLTELLWSAEDCRKLRNSKNSLQNELLKIRRLTESQFIEQRPGYGYRLSPNVQVDRFRLRNLANQADRFKLGALEQIDEILDEVKQIWRGTPWIEIEDIEDVNADIYATERDRRQVELRYCEIACHSRAGAVAILAEDLVTAAPSDRAWHVYAKSLYLTGRQADALNVIGQARQWVSARGATLAPSLETLERAVLNHEPIGEPSLQRPPAMSVNCSTGRLFVGRASELRRLQDLADRASAGQFTTGLVTGPSGIGKTWLANEAGGGAAGVRGLFAPCSQYGALPLQPLAEAIGTLDNVMAQDLINMLSDPDGRAPEGHFFHQLVWSNKLTELLDSIGQTTLIVDDVQWADEATLSVLCRLVDCKPSGVFLLVLMRDEPSTVPALTRLREQIARSGTVFPLKPLTNIELVELATGLNFPDINDAGIERFASATGGLPLLATLNLQHLQSAGENLDSAGSTLSSELEVVVGAQLDLAGDLTTEVLQWIALSETPTPMSVLTQAAGLNLTEAIAAAELAELLHLATELGPNVFELTHTTLRTGLLQGLSHTRRAWMHSRLAETLEAENQGDQWPLIAYHALKAGCIGLAAQATIQAAKIALERFSPTDALNLITALLDVLPQSALPPAVHVDLLIEATSAASYALDLNLRRQFATEARNLARKHQLDDHLARIALIAAANWPHGSFDTEVAADLHEAIARLETSPDPALQAHLYANLAGMYAVSGTAKEHDQAATALHYSATALDYAHISKDDNSKRVALQARILCLWSTQAYEEQIELTDQINALAQGHAESEATGLRWRAVPQFCLGERAAFHADRVRLETLAAALKGRGALFNGYARQWAAMEALLDGDWDTANRLAKASYKEFRDEKNIGNGALTQLLWCAIETGVHVGLPEQAEENAEANPDLPGAGVFAAYTWGVTGHPDQARHRLAEVIKGDPNSIPRDITRTAIIAAIAEICVLTADRELATSLIDTLEPWHGTLICVTGGLWSLGAADRTTALFHLTLGNHKEAIDLLHQAQAIEQPIAAAAVNLRTLTWLTRAGDANHQTTIRQIETSGQHGLLNLLR